MTTLDKDPTDEMDDRGLGRRGLLRAAAGGFALAASGLFLPERVKEAEAREGADGGRLGGRHGPNRRGRDQRTRRDSKGKQEDRNDRGGKPPGAGLTIVKAVALNIRNDAQIPITIETWWDQNPALGNGWEPAHATRHLQTGETFAFQSPTRSAALWIASINGWLHIFNPLAGAPEAAFKDGGGVQRGVGHTGGWDYIQPFTLSAGESKQWSIRLVGLNLARQADSDDSKVFALRFWN